MKISASRYAVKVILCLTLLVKCTEKNGRFVLLSPDETGVHFNNSIFENDSVNIFDFANIYNGGGVAVADFNSDGLQDLYFTGNMVANKLYVNKGGLKFQDVTAASHTDGKSVWSRGVAVIDINNDQKPDLYVCATAKRDPMQRINILYINKGTDKNNVPVFQDMAEEYGLADTTQSTMAYFFDYDNDTDLDVYIAVNHIIQDDYTNVYKERNVNGEHPSTGRLYRNDWNDSLKHPYFTDVSRKAGILIEGYSHAANIADFNQDGWQDIFVANDYISNNVLYINNKDGTFTDRVQDYFKHGAANSMGTDAVDMNNDGLEDIIEVDMAPQDNFRKKMFLNPITYQNYVNSEFYGYQYQYIRNMLHINQGPTVREEDSIGHPIFADAGYFAGVAETDWSWTPLAADFDNDGNKDIIFTNGFPKDITDHDFMVFRHDAARLTSEKDMLDEIPVVKIHNYAYRNSGNLRFSDQTSNWGLQDPRFSNGAVYADLDNDGDLDLVINNINDPAMIYENRISTGRNNNYLQIKFRGPALNINGIGAEVIVHTPANSQSHRNNPYRGYLSSVSPVMHFGLGKEKVIDSVQISWPGGAVQMLRDIKANQVLAVDIRNAAVKSDRAIAVIADKNWFTNITRRSGISYVHDQRDFIDFNIQKLLPHKLSEYSPGIAAGDVNNDGLDDLVTSGSPGFSAMLFMQKSDGRFSTEPILKTGGDQKRADERGVLLFDADGDADQDLFISSGGYAYEPGDSAYNDVLYINNGKGVFTPDTKSLPLNTTSKFCVRAADYDRDGDLDLFIAGRVEPWAYPKPVSSFIYRNDSGNDAIRFTDVTGTIAPALRNAGLACDAVFSDYDNDGWPDLILAGEWMPITIFHNEKGRFVPVSSTGIEDNKGWWTSLAPGDFDNDGDIDYIAGNLGLNSFYRASDEHPVTIRANDFDNNGSYDAIPALYLPATSDFETQVKEFPAHTRDDMIKQIISTRNKFRNYRSYAIAPVDSVVPAENTEGMLKLSANYLSSAYIENKGGGRFAMSSLPAEAQMSVLNGMVAEDFNSDGFLDLCVNTNDYSSDPNVGRHDAMNGIVLQGDGTGKFTPLSVLQSGIFIPGNGKGLAMLSGKNNSSLLAATQNRGPLLLYQSKRISTNKISASPDDAFAIIHYKSEKRRRVEFYYGSSFLSQSTRSIYLNNSIARVELTDRSGKVRIVENR